MRIGTVPAQLTVTSPPGPVKGNSELNCGKHILVESNLNVPSKTP